MFVLRQDVSMLDELAEAGHPRSSRSSSTSDSSTSTHLDHVVCHYSTNMFRDVAFDGAAPPHPDPRHRPLVLEPRDPRQHRVGEHLHRPRRGLAHRPLRTGRDGAARGARVGTILVRLRPPHRGRPTRSARSTDMTTDTTFATRRRMPRPRAPARSPTGSPRSGSSSRSASTEVPVLQPARRRHGDPRRLPAAALQPAPAGRRRFAVDLARGIELRHRPLRAARGGDPSRRGGAPRLPHARTRLRRDRRLARRAARRPQERRLRGALRATCSTTPTSRTRSGCSARCSSSRGSARSAPPGGPRGSRRCSGSPTTRCTSCSTTRRPTASTPATSRRS